MKATGIVRRIDDLGRVVIPKEIRRTLRIRDGDPLEIYTARDGEVIFKKYSPVGELSDFATQICESLNKTCGGIVAVCDRDCIIAVAGATKKEFLEKSISSELTEIMENRKPYYADTESPSPLIEDNEDICLSVAVPILSGGDVLGCVVFASNKEEINPDDAKIKVATAVAGFLGRQMED